MIMIMILIMITIRGLSPVRIMVRVHIIVVVRIIGRVRILGQSQIRRRIRRFSVSISIYFSLGWGEFDGVLYSNFFGGGISALSYVANSSMNG